MEQNLCHIELLKIDYYIIPVDHHVPSAAQRCVVPLCGPLQQGQQQQYLLSHCCTGCVRAHAEHLLSHTYTLRLMYLQYTLCVNITYMSLVVAM